MLGAIAGDVIGSVYEARPVKTTEFPLFDEDCRFTDDTVLTVAVADCLLNARTYVDAFHEYWRKYSHAGFGGSFTHWALSKNLEPYNSWGNGSAMRVSPVAYAFDQMDEVLAEAERSASITHSHEEGIRGAQATAAAVFLARQGEDKVKIREYVESQFGYDLHRSLDQLRPDYQFDVSCQGSVPESIISFLESEDFESSLRNAISLGGDADTMACIAGAIAEPFYGGVPESIARRVVNRLDDPLRNILVEFSGRYIKQSND
jgi:ADP-ribosylglycohydrolase